jgi:hypothetical protein
MNLKIAVAFFIAFLFYAVHGVVELLSRVVTLMLQ